MKEEIGTGICSECNIKFNKPEKQERWVRYIDDETNEVSEEIYEPRYICPECGSPNIRT